MFPLAFALVLAGTAPADSVALPAQPFMFREVRAYGVEEGAPPLLDAAGVAVDALGHVWASDAEAHRVPRWDAGGRPLGEIGALGSDANQFRRPGALARVGSFGVAVLDVGNRRVVTYDLLGRATDRLIQLDDAVLESAIGRVTPVGLAADLGGALYVADAERDRILAFDFNGAFLRTLGGYGPGPGTFHGLTAIAVAAHGELVTGERPLPPARRKRGQPADSSGALPARVQVLDAGGSPLSAWPLPAAEIPVAVAMDDSGRVAVAVRAGDGGAVELFDRAGRLLAVRRDVQSPRALAFAADGALLVAEGTGRRVLRLAIVAFVRN